MTLRCQAAEQASRAATETNATGGQIVLSIDEDGIGHVARFADAKQLAASDVLLDVRREHARVQLASDAWFFEEGTAERYEAARYGGFRVAADGRARLGSVHDEIRVAIEDDESH